MDKLSKLAFLTVFILPVIIILFTAWFFLGEQRVHGGVAQGYFDGLSVMIIPTFLAVIVGIIIKHNFFRKR